MITGVKTIAQYIILRWIDKHFTDMEIVILGPDVVQIIDCRGESMKLSINIHEQIIDYDTREILPD